MFQGTDCADDSDAPNPGFRPSVAFVDEEQGLQFNGEADRCRFFGVSCR